jgi:hypothetical protein
MSALVLLVGTGVPSRPGCHPSTGGVGGSRADEAKNSPRWVQGPGGSQGVLGRALDAPAEPVTLATSREATRPPQGAAA